MDSSGTHDETNALIGAVSKALEMSEVEVMVAIEQGRLTMETAMNEDGRTYLLAACDDREARIDLDAIFTPGAL